MLPGRAERSMQRRCCSLAVRLGYFTPEFTGKLPGYLSPSLGFKFAGMLYGLSAISKVPSAGWAQVFVSAELAIGRLDLMAFFELFFLGDPTGSVWGVFGDVGFFGEVVFSFVFVVGFGVGF